MEDTKKNHTQKDLGNFLESKPERKKSEAKNQISHELEKWERDLQKSRT